ncbi:MAG: immunoglobulin-like domain-containing protein [bacterium]
MKKLFLGLVTILVSLSLFGCNSEPQVDFLKEAYDDLTIEGDLNNVVDDIELTTKINEVVIIWSSSNVDVISITGEVTRPSVDTTVLLTAELEYNNETKEKEFNLKVIAQTNDSVLVDSAYNQLTLETTYTEDIYLIDEIDDVTITWSSSNTSVVSNNGLVTRPSVDTNVLLTATLTYNEVVKTKEFTVTIKAEVITDGLTDQEVVNLAKTNLALNGDLDNVTSNISLPTTLDGVTITWATSNDNVISTEGIVSRLADDTTVLLTATLKLNDATATKEFSVIVIGDPNAESASDAQKVNEAAEMLDIEGDLDNVTEDLNLPLSYEEVNVTWKSNNEEVLSNTGVVVRPTVDTEVILTATLSLNAATETLRFYVTVLAVELSDQEKVDYVKNNLVIDMDLENVTSKIQLPYSVEGIDDVTVVWSSSNELVVDKYGNVSRQDVNVTLVLTATITLNDITTTKEYTVTVLELESISLEDAINSTVNTDVVVKDLIVMSLSKDGYYVTDNTNIIFVYTGSTPNVEVGDLGMLSGTRAVYYDLQQIKSASFTVKGTDTVTINPIELSIEEYYALENRNGYYKLEGTLVSTMILESNGIKVNFSQNQLSTDILHDFVGEDISINVFTHIFKSNEAYVYFNGTEEDITIKVLTDQEKVDRVLSELTLDEKVSADMTLITTSHDATITWSSNNEEVISNNGVVVRQDTETEVVLTATITLNDVTTTKDFTVTVLAKPSGDVQEVTFDFRIGQNMGTEYKTSTFNFFNDTIFALTSLTSTWGGVNGGVDGGIKFGSGSKNGSFTIESSEVVITKVVVTSKYYDSTSSLVVNGTPQTITSEFTEYTFDINSNTLTIGSDAKRIWVEQITIFYE